MGLNIPLDAGLAAGMAGITAEATFFFYRDVGAAARDAGGGGPGGASSLGFGLACIRQNETAADMIGVNATLYKSLAFALSACFVAMAGTLYAGWVHYIDPSDVFDILYSVKPIVMALIGGLGSPPVW